MAVPANVPRDPKDPDLRKQISSSMRMETFKGPIPPPAVLEAYESLVPGAAQRILKMAENQASHRQEIEKIVVKAGAEILYSVSW